METPVQGVCDQAGSLTYSHAPSSRTQSRALTRTARQPVCPGREKGNRPVNTEHCLCSRGSKTGLVLRHLRTGERGQQQGEPLVEDAVPIWVRVPRRVGNTVFSREHWARFQSAVPFNPQPFREARSASLCGLRSRDAESKESAQ